MAVFHLLPQFHFINERTIIGGYPSAVGRLAVAQAAGGSDVEIVSRMPALSISSFSGVKLFNLEIVDSTSHRHPFRFAKKLFSFLRHLRHRLSAEDSLHFHSGRAEYAVISGFVALMFRRRVLHTLYCPLVSGPRGLVQRLAILLARFCGVLFTGMSRNVCNSIPVESSWTPPVIDSDYLRPQPSKASDCQILFVGNATLSKGLADLLPAFGNLVDKNRDRDDLQLVVTTELARTGERGHLQDVVDNLSVDASSRVTWLSIVPDMRDLISRSTIHVAPFRDTNGPSDYFMATLEAMSMGKVCVVSDLNGMAEVVRDGENGFSFRAGDAIDLERALQRALDCDHVAVGEQARDFVVQTFGTAAVNTVNNLYATNKRLNGGRNA